MGKKSIWLIVILMSTALIGLSIIQFVWIKWSIDLSEKNFNDKVLIAISRTKDRVQADVKNNDIITYANRSKKTKFISDGQLNLKKKYSGTSDWERRRLDLTMGSKYGSIGSTSALEQIDNKKLDNYIKHALDEQGIELEYDYGIFSNKQNNFLIINGNFAVSVGDEQASNIESNKSLYDSDYKIPMFENSNIIPGYLKLYFPEKGQFLISSVLKNILSSILFTGLILFCFVYTINVIVRQKKVSEMKNDFINNMTHEFKTPIATISLASDSILNPSIINDQSKIKRFLGIIKQENKRMLSQVEKVLQMAVLDRKDFTLNKTEVNMIEVINQAATHTRLLVASREGIVRTHLRSTSPMIVADQTHISNLIHNLLDNAYKYSPEKPEIDLTLEDKGKDVKITIKDNGIGMSAENQKNIFDKFYRVHTGNLHDVKGFGLGLSYVKAIVDAHGGTILVQSELEKGSSFIVTLPRESKIKLS